MSVLGPISTLQAAQPAAYLDIDFTKGYVTDEELSLLNFTRASRSMRVTKPGQVEFVEAGQPAISWVPESQAYGLMCEASATNLLVTRSSSSTGNPLSPLGWSGAIGVAAEHVKAPDGSMTAIRVSGTQTGRPTATGGANSVLATADGSVSLVFCARAAPGGNGILPLQFRNSTKNQQTDTINFDLIGGTYTATTINHIRMQRLADGWWLIFVTQVNTDFFAEGDIVTFYLPSWNNGAIQPTDFWYASFSASPLASSLILPGASSAMTRSQAKFDIDLRPYGSSTRVDAALVADYSYIKNTPNSSLHLEASGFAQGNGRRGEIFLPFNASTAPVIISEADEGINPFGAYRANSAIGQIKRERCALSVFAGYPAMVAANSGVAVGGANSVGTGVMLRFQAMRRSVGRGIWFFHHIRVLFERPTQEQLRAWTRA